MMERGQAVMSGRPLNAGRHTQRGISLLLALLFVALFGGILAVIAQFQSSQVRVSEARVAGWELVEIAKAARLFMRDRYANNPTLPTTLDAGPVPLTLAMLRAGGYLPANFGRTVGGLDYNVLNQRIVIMQVNWSPAGMGGVPTAGSTVPSAIVYFMPGPKSTAQTALATIESAKMEGATVNSILFNGATNISMICRAAGPAVGLWDTGCMTQGEFSTLAAAAGVGTTFLPGAVIMPAWKAVQPDLRAVMRYPQPENPGYATMLTDLYMGRPTGDCSLAANQVMITRTNSSGGTENVSTGVCDVVDDTGGPGGVNERFNIQDASNVVMERMVAEAQTTDFGGETGVIGSGDDDVMRINGSAKLSQDLRVYNVRPMPTTGTVPNARLSVPNGTTVVERNSYLYSQNTSRAGIATIRTATSGALVSDNLTTPSFISQANGSGGAAPQVNVTTQTTLTGDMNVANELLAESVNAPSAQIVATDNTGQVQVTGTLTLQNNSVAYSEGQAPATGYAAIIGEVTNANSVAVNGVAGPDMGTDLRFIGGSRSVTMTSGRYYGGTSSMRLVETGDYGQCKEGKRVAGACPDRQYTPATVTP